MYKGSDTVSETSDCGTVGTSISGQESSSYDGSREDLRDLAALLGLSGVDQLYEERFRVSRKELELLLLGQYDGEESAEDFFQKIMKDTTTVITWPSKLKIGAKSKKDPHVRIAGRIEDVSVARTKVLKVLGNRSNNVTMKIDVSYTDHSHIIGKAGQTIKSVMDSTQCHIHFPDSNRTNATEKSNQVSISGIVQGVEKARERVRALMPLIFTFELPVVGAINSVPHLQSPYLQDIQQKYNVQIMFRTQPKFHATLVVIKGCEWEVAQVKEATLLVISHLCSNVANQVYVNMNLEISPQHHAAVLGKNGCNLKTIMQQTVTQIMFPDAEDPNIPSLKKSNVTVTGLIHNVYIARQQLIGSLPVVLLFDLPSSFSVDTDHIDRISTALDVFINVRHKPKHNTLSVIIKGIERNVGNIYEARRQLLKLEEPRIIANVPPTYHIPDVPVLNMLNNSEILPHAARPNRFGFPCFPMPPLWNSCLSSPVSMYSSQVMSPLQCPLLSSTPYGHMMLQPPQTPLHLRRSPSPLELQRLGLGFIPQSPSASDYSFNQMNNHLNGINTHQLPLETKKSNNTPSLSSATSSLSSPTVSPRDGALSPMNNLDSMLSNMLLDDQHSAASNGSYSPPSLDYERKKMLASKAMQEKPVTGELRVPTSNWSGCGFSKSSPSAPTKTRSRRSDDCALPERSGDAWSTAGLPDFLVSDYDSEQVASASNYLDATPKNILDKIFNNSQRDISTLLASLGLEKYTHLFKSHEIDVNMFPTLTDDDLKEIGVTSFGSRRKLLVAIADINRKQNLFSGSAAPGAERKFLSTSETRHGKW